MTHIAKVFQNGRSQAVRIPRDIRLESSEVYIEKQGDSLIIRPKKEDDWESFFALLQTADTDGFLSERQQPPRQERKLF